MKSSKKKNNLKYHYFTESNQTHPASTPKHPPRASPNSSIQQEQQHAHCRLYDLVKAGSTRIGSCRRQWRRTLPERAPGTNIIMSPLSGRVNPRRSRVRNEARAELSKREGAYRFPFNKEFVLDAPRLQSIGE